MRRGRVKQLRIRVTKRRTKPLSNDANQVHDGDVLRWCRMFNDDEALVAANMAGPGGAGLPACQACPAASPAPCVTALQYIDTLPGDARQVVFRHCELVSRHEQMLLEGQERLKYVQAQIREMRERMSPSPPPAPRQQDAKGKGPNVTADPVPQPSCWASCCGLFPLPPPRAPPPLPPPPTVIRLPNASYFREEAAKRGTRAAARMVEKEQTQQRQQEQATACSAVQPVAASVGGASDVIWPVTAAAACASTTVAASGGPLGTQLLPQQASDHQQQQQQQVFTSAELPGQLGSRQELAAPTMATNEVAVAPPSPVPPALADALSPLLPQPPALAPLLGKTPGAPQSLLRPLAPIGGVPVPMPGEREGLAAELGACSKRSQLPQLTALPVHVQAATSATCATESAAARRDTAPAPPMQPDGLLPSASSSAAAQAASKAAAEVALSRYQDPESISKVIRIQAALRGHIARKQLAGAQEQQERQRERQPRPDQQQVPARASSRKVVEAKDDGMSGVWTRGEGGVAGGREGAAARSQHPINDPTSSGGKLPPL